MAFLLDWIDELTPRAAKQLPLFESLNTHQQSIVDMLRQHEQLHIDQLSHLSGMSYGEIASALLELELQNLVRAIPGKKFELTH
jgi:DNA processing protein